MGRGHKKDKKSHRPVHLFRSVLLMFFVVIFFFRPLFFSGDFGCNKTSNKNIQSKKVAAYGALPEMNTRKGRALLKKKKKKHLEI